MEFIKDGCKENNSAQCNWCKDTGWKGPTIYSQLVPAPMPNSENPGHFKDVFDTYMYNKRDTGEAQPVDEFAPQSCKHTQKKLFTPDNICISVKAKNGIEESSILLKRNMLQPTFNTWKSRKHVH